MPQSLITDFNLQKFTRVYRIRNVTVVGLLIGVCICILSDVQPTQRCMVSLSRTCHNTFQPLWCQQRPSTLWQISQEKMVFIESNIRSIPLISSTNVRQAYDQLVRAQARTRVSYHFRDIKPCRSIARTAIGGVMIMASVVLVESIGFVFNSSPFCCQITAKGKCRYVLLSSSSIIR